MVKRIYVGNLPFTCTDEEIRGLFEAYGSVRSVNLISDRDTGRPRGFGFVEMENADEAIEALHQREFGGRTLTVNEARPRQQQRESRGGGGGGRW